MTFGWEPLSETIILTRNADFIMSLTNRKGPVPVGTTVRIVLFSGETWQGTVSGDTVSWNVEADITNTIVDRTQFKIYVSYPAAGGVRDDFVWYRGLIRRVDNGNW